MIPTYNRANFLDRALRSLVLQSNQNFSVIITDNNSSDSTNKVVTEYKNKLNISFIESKTNTGAVTNWQRGLNATKSKWVKVLYSDDWLEPNALEELSNFVQFNSLDIGLCGAYGHLSNEVRGWVGESFLNLKWKDLVPKMVQGKITASASCALIKTEHAIEGLESNYLDRLAYETAIGPDLLMLYWSAIKGGNVGYLSKPLINMNASDDSISVVLGEKLRPLYAHSIIIGCHLNNCQIEKNELKILNHWIKEGVLLRRIPELIKTPGRISIYLIIKTWPYRGLLLFKRKLSLYFRKS